jgi:hypothetical protein
VIPLFSKPHKTRRVFLQLLLQQFPDIFPSIAVCLPQANSFLRFASLGRRFAAVKISEHFASLNLLRAQTLNIKVDFFN